MKLRRGVRGGFLKTKDKRQKVNESANSPFEEGLGDVYEIIRQKARNAGSLPGGVRGGLVWVKITKTYEHHLTLTYTA